jgi:hypothetical protein
MSEHTLVKKFTLAVDATSGRKFHVILTIVVFSFCRYSDKTALKKHEKTHQEGQKYDCRQCCVSFVTKSELVLHCKEHEVKKKLCGKKFSSRANLQEHLHTHSKEKSFECNIYY